jgi:hypothetical protein
MRAAGIKHVRVLAQEKIALHAPHSARRFILLTRRLRFPRQIASANLGVGASSLPFPDPGPAHALQILNCLFTLSNAFADKLSAFSICFFAAPRACAFRYAFQTRTTSPRRCSTGYGGAAFVSPWASR